MSFQALLWKDLRRELRSKESLQAGLVLVGLFFILYLFAITSLDEDVSLGAIAMWTPILYGTAALAARGMQSEVDRGTLDLLRTLPVPAHWHGWSRTIVTFLLTALLATFSLLLANIGFLLPLTPRIWIIAAFAVTGLSLTGSLAGALTAQTRSAQTLMPILLIPISAPLLQAGIQATIDALQGGNEPAPLLLMAGYNTIMLGITWILWPYALETD